MRNISQRNLIYQRAVVSDTEVDATHITIAVTNHVNYLVTWNLRHIANAAVRSRVQQVCSKAGCRTPLVICTPKELMEEGFGNR